MIDEGIAELCFDSAAGKAGRPVAKGRFPASSNGEAGATSRDFQGARGLRSEDSTSSVPQTPKGPLLNCRSVKRESPLRAGYLWSTAHLPKYDEEKIYRYQSINKGVLLYLVGYVDFRTSLSLESDSK
jgi:hypothetical protein